RGRAGSKDVDVVGAEVDLHAELTGQPLQLLAQSVAVGSRRQRELEEQHVGALADDARAEVDDVGAVVGERLGHRVHDARSVGAERGDCDVGHAATLASASMATEQRVEQQWETPSYDEIPVISKMHVQAMETSDADEVWSQAGMKHVLITTIGRKS